MSDPLAVLDGLKAQNDYDDNGGHPLADDQWNELRAAIEAQAAELAQAKKGWETTSEYAKGCGETIAMLQDELAQARARIGRLEDEISIALIALFNNYDRKTDTSTGIRAIVDCLSAALKESPSQSLAAVRAEALREGANAAGDEAPTNGWDAGWNSAVRDARESAARIEREAKESG